MLHEAKIAYYAFDATILFASTIGPAVAKATWRHCLSHFINRVAERTCCAVNVLTSRISFLFSWPWWMGSVVKHNMLKISEKVASNSDLAGWRLFGLADGLSLVTYQSGLTCKPAAGRRVSDCRYSLPSGRATNQQHDTSFGSAPHSRHQSSVESLLLGRTELCGVKQGSELNTILFCYVYNCCKVNGTSASQLRFYIWPKCGISWLKNLSVVVTPTMHIPQRLLSFAAFSSADLLRCRFFFFCGAGDQLGATLLRCRAF